MPSTTEEAEILSRLDEDLAGLDALELAAKTRTSRLARVWRATWPKLGAIAIFFGIWQLVVWSGWRPTYLLPPPSAVLRELGLELPAEVEVRVWDSSSEVRYLVLPERPAGSEALSEEALRGCVTRDAMIGVALARVPDAR